MYMKRAIKTNKDQDIFKSLLPKAVEHIEDYWPQLERVQIHDEGTVLGMPRPYVVPSRSSGIGFAFEEMFYWDSYFIALGLLGTERQQLAFDMLENICALIGRYGMMPNGSRAYFTSRSQPPFLTSYILAVYAHHQGSKEEKEKWLIEKMDLAKREYKEVWISTAHPHWRNVYKGLSRYYDINVLHDLAEAESGWDMNPRFGRRCLDFLPVDLNALLFKYEMDFADIAEQKGDTEEAAEWRERATQRKAMVDQLMWNQSAGMYFDYDWRRKRQGSVRSLATLYPLWAGMASPEQASKIVSKLSVFERVGGLLTTTKGAIANSEFPEQWAYPNGWAPLHWLAVEGLERYGYNEDAKRIARKWLETNLIQFQKTGEFLEKYNVASPDRPARKGVYPMQTGFGWTNSVFLVLAQRYAGEVYPKASLPKDAVRKLKKGAKGVAAHGRKKK